MALEWLTNAFTGKPVKDAAAQQQAYLKSLQDRASGIYGGARTGGLDALRSGQAGGIDAITGGVAQGRQDLQASLDPALAALYGGTGQAANELTGGRDAALNELRSGVDQAAGAYDPLSALGGKYGDRVDLASLMSENALGLRGGAGNDAAVGAFRAGPGYENTVNEAIRAATRGADVGGMVAGGNVLDELARVGGNLADKEYQTWLGNLRDREGLYAPLEASTTGAAAAGRGNAYLTGATGGANIYTGTAGRLSDLYTGQGRDVANLYSGTGQRLSDLASRGGFGVADIFGQTAGREADLWQRLAAGETGFLGDTGKQYNQTYADIGNAEMGGSKNLWNLIGSGAELAAGIGTGGLSTFGSAAFKGATGKKNLLGSGSNWFAGA